MIIYENRCVGCPSEIGCWGPSCPNMNVKIYKCDLCHDEVDILYDYGGDQLCERCLLDKFAKIE